MGFSASAMAQSSLIGQMSGAVTSGIGSYFSADTRQTSLDAQASIAQTNARIAEMGAQSALAQGQQQVAAITLRAGQIKSAQRTSLAANGVDLGVGSAAELQASTDIMKTADANTARSNAISSAWGYRTQATNYQNDALMKRAEGDSVSPFGAAATSLLGSAGGVASNWYQYNKAGMLKGTSFELGS